MLLIITAEGIPPPRGSGHLTAPPLKINPPNEAGGRPPGSAATGRAGTGYFSYATGKA